MEDKLPRYMNINAGMRDTGTSEISPSRIHQLGVNGLGYISVIGVKLLGWLVGFRIRSFVRNQRLSGISNGISGAEIIVTLTSFSERVLNPRILPLALYSLHRQTLKPNRIILWLSDDEFPNRTEDLPQSVTQFCDKGLTILWTQNIQSYRKLIPALSHYPDAILVTADDDFFYPKSWLSDLVREWRLHPEDIVAHRVKRVAFTAANCPTPYTHWPRVNEKTSSLLNFPTTGGGVLYPPHALHPSTINVAQLMRIAPSGDDIWFWGMAVLNQTRIRSIGTKHDPVDLIPNKANHTTLFHVNVTQNDLAIARLLASFREILDHISRPNSSRSLS